MSAEVLKKALELASSDIAEDTPGPSTTKTNLKRKARRTQEAAVVSSISAKKKPLVKSVIEQTLDKPKTDYLLHNLRYLKHSQERKVDSEKMRKIIEAYDAEKRGRQYWRKHDWDFQKKRKKHVKKPCVFSEEDFKRWAATLKPKLRKKILS